MPPRPTDQATIPERMRAFDVSRQQGYTAGIVVPFHPCQTRGNVIKVDLHVHTHHSPDSLARPDAIRRWARRHDIDVVAITDHDTIAAAVEMRRRWPEFVIVGEEIKSNQGEIIGLFLQEEVPAGLSPAETIRCIRRQGGLVVVPHPMDRMRGSALSRDALQDIVRDVDVIETLNARVALAADNRLAQAFAREHGLPQGAGSDAHLPAEVGTAHVEMRPFSTPQDFMAAIAHARVRGRLASPLVHMGSAYARVVKCALTALGPAR